MVKKINLFPIFLIGGFALIIFALFGSGITGNVTAEDTSLVSCDIKVNNPLVGDPYVESMTCEDVGECGFLNSLTVQPLLFGYQGSLVVTSGEDTEKVNFDIGINSAQTYNVKVCTSTNRVLATVKDSNNNIVDTKEVTV